jgi:hypothetical protein
VRDIEFLPDWYPMIRRRYRTVVVQAYATVVILIALGGYAGIKRWQVFTARKMTAKTDVQIDVTKTELIQLTDKLKFQEQLRHENSVVARLGVGVDTTRLLAAIEDAMPAGVALTGFSCETVDQKRPAPSRPAGSKAPTADKTIPEETDRRMNVVIDGLSPTDVQAAALVEKLNDVPFFQDVQLAYLRDGKTRDGRPAREFELTFNLHLTPAGNDGK